MPGCGDQVALVLVTPGSVQATIQVITIGVDVPCEDISETAWGGDYFGDPLEFGGRTWAIYFLYEVQ